MAHIRSEQGRSLFEIAEPVSRTVHHPRHRERIDKAVLLEGAKIGATQDFGSSLEPKHGYGQRLVRG